MLLMLLKYNTLLLISANMITNCSEDKELAKQADERRGFFLPTHENGKPINKLCLSWQDELRIARLAAKKAAETATLDKKSDSSN